MTSLHWPQNILFHVQNHLCYQHCLWLSSRSAHAVPPSWIAVQKFIYTCHTDIVHFHSTLYYTNTNFYNLLLPYFNSALHISHWMWVQNHTYATNTVLGILCAVPYDNVAGLRILHFLMYTFKQEVCSEKRLCSTGNCNWQWMFWLDCLGHYGMAGFTLWSLPSNFCCFISCIVMYVSSASRDLLL